MELDAAKADLHRYLQIGRDVLVWKLDRFGRSVINLLNNVEELRRAGVRFICVTQGLEVASDSDAICQKLTPQADEGEETQLLWKVEVLYSTKGNTPASENSWTA